METRPLLDVGATAEALEEAYGITVAEIVFLPLGADPEAAAWRVSVANGPPLFLKTRHGRFDAEVLAVSRYLRDAGIEAVLAPVPTRKGKLFVDADGIALILYPFVAGRSGFDVALEPAAWRALGAALNRIHAAKLPERIARHLGAEAFGGEWRDRVRAFLDTASKPARHDPVAARLAEVLLARAGDVERIVSRAEALATSLRGRKTRTVLCHTDLHAGNVLVGPEGAVHIVDWDSPRLAPPERDLMFIGGGVGGAWNEAWEAEAFYEGYGHTGIDAEALAYYRYERIVEDIAVTCELVFGGEAESRAESLAQLLAQWRAGDVIEVADATHDRLLAGEA